MTGVQTCALPIYEMGLGLMGKCGKSRNLALKGIEEEIDDSEDDEENKDLTFMDNEIIRLLQYRKNDKDKPPRKSKSSRTRFSDPDRLLNRKRERFKGFEVEP